MKSPFKFLDSYTKEDRETFFGREREIEELYHRVFESKIMLVYGVSGTGKTSLINCGLTNKLLDPDWLPITIRRGNDILKSFASGIRKELITPYPGNIENSSQFIRAVKSLYFDHYRPVFFIFDQFEEVFIFGNKDERKAFIHVVRSLIEAEIQCRFIFVMREEYMAGITEFEKYIPTIFQNRVRIEKMSHTNALEAIKGPSKVAGIEVEKGFAESLLEKLSPEGVDVELTYLQVYLDKIFHLAESNSFSINLLVKIGSVSDLLGAFLDDQISLLDNPDTGMAVLKSFVSLLGTRKQMSSEEILEYSRTLGKEISESELQELLQLFVNLRILKDKDQNEKYELRHDALAGKIYENITLVEKEILEIRQFIENAYSNWQKRGVLLGKEDLDYIAPYESRLYLTGNHETLIEKSRKELVRVRLRRRNFITIAGLMLILILSVFTFWALKERSKALSQSRNSRVLFLVAKAKESINNDPTKAIRYAQLAYNLDSTNALANQTLSDIFHASGSNPFYKNSLYHRDNLFSSNFSQDGNYIITCSLDKTAKIWDKLGNCLATLSGHTEGVYYGEFSPDGKLVITASNDNTAKIWNLSGQCLSTFLGHNSTINSARFSPDGKNVLTTSYDRTAKLWDLSGKCLLTLSEQSSVSAAVFSPNSKYILTYSNDDKSAKLWDLTGECLIKYVGHTSIVNSAVFSADGKDILTSSDDKTAKLWDLSGRCLLTLSGHSSRVRSAVFSPDGKRILTASSDKTAKLWDLSGSCISTLVGHTGAVMTAMFSLDENKILTSASDNKVKLWNPSGKCLMTLPALYPGLSNSAIFSPDGNSVITLSPDYKANIYDLSEKYLIVLSNLFPANSAVFSPKGNSILTYSFEKTAKLWDLSGRCLAILAWNRSYLTSAFFSPDGNYILTSYVDRTAKFWDLNGKCLKTFQGKGRTTIANSASFSPDSKKILITSDDSKVSLWNLSGQCLSTFLGHNSTINSAIFSPDGNYVLSASDDSTSKLWSLSGECLTTFMDLKSGIINAKFSPEGRHVLTISQDKTMRIWDLSGKCHSTFTIPSSSIYIVVFSPDSKYILISSEDKTAKLFDISGNCIATLAGHSSNIRYAVFSPDGKRILTASSDKTAKLWDLSGRCLATLYGHTSDVIEVSFSSDGRFIITTSIDNTPKIWNLSGECLANLSGHSSMIMSAVFSPDGAKVISASGDATARIWFMPSAINKWLSKTRIDNLNPMDKYEIGEFDNFKTIQMSYDFSFVIGYADWYLKNHFLSKAEILYERAMQLNPIALDKRILGNIYKTQKEETKYLNLYKNDSIGLIKNDIFFMETSRSNYYIPSFTFFLEKAKLIERLLLLDSLNQNKIDAAYTYYEMGRAGLRIKEYNLALKATQRGIELDPLNDNLITNLALCYLLNNQTKNADSVYIKYKNKLGVFYSSFVSYKEAFLNDLKTFEMSGISNPDFEKVKELLK